MYKFYKLCAGGKEKLMATAENFKEANEIASQIHYEIDDPSIAEYFAQSDEIAGYPSLASYIEDCYPSEGEIDVLRKGIEKFGEKRFVTIHDTGRDAWEVKMPEDVNYIEMIDGYDDWRVEKNQI